MYAKTKEIDPVGGAHAVVPPLDPPMNMIGCLVSFVVRTHLVAILHACLHTPTPETGFCPELSNMPVYVQPFVTECLNQNERDSERT